MDRLHRLLRATCREVGEPTPRSRYLKWARYYMSYSKMKRKTKKKSRPLTRGLLLLLDKFSGELDRLEGGHTLKRTADQYRRRATAKRIYAQQHAYFHHGERLSDRIVSLDKDYIRPIVRGKETRTVEFGAKVNKFQIDGIGFRRAPELRRLPRGHKVQGHDIQGARDGLAQDRDCRGDAIYVTNKIRVFANRYGIRTDFKRKGRAGRHEAQRKKMATAITKERASRLKGSSGTEKEHYHLKKIRARTKDNETLWIFFGIHTANDLKIGRRMAIAVIGRAA